MTRIQVGGDDFSAGCDLIEVTSLHRPDTSWRVVDAKGHEHRWYVDGKLAVSYDPEARYTTPTLINIHDDWEYYEDGERTSISHFECRECGEHIEPGYTADAYVQHIPGLRWYRINGLSVSREEFERRVTEAQR